MIEPGFGAYTAAVRNALGTGYGRSRRVRAAVRLVADFHAWRALAALGEDQAVELSAEIVELAARTD